MFTGIVTDIGEVRKAEQRGDLRLVIGTTFALDQIALGASIACSGVCLTVVDKGDDWFAVDVSGETASRTAADRWRQGARLNLERAARLGDELGGHIVAGHIDAVGEIVDVTPAGDSVGIAVAVPASLGGLIAAKGSITLDGVSLTANTVEDSGDGTTRFTVNIIPHTAAHTTLSDMAVGRQLNVEIDIIARYLQRLLTARSH